MTKQLEIRKGTGKAQMLCLQHFAHIHPTQGLSFAASVLIIKCFMLTDLWSDQRPTEGMGKILVCFGTCPTYAGFLTDVIHHSGWDFPCPE